MAFQKEEPGIYRLTVPFEKIYTTVFALNEGDKWILCDTATTDLDVKNFILPALRDLGAKPDYIFVSHSHGDHAGGLASLFQAFPNAEIIIAPTILCGSFEILSLKGHSEDSLAIFDSQTKTLLSFDCLQQRGINKYRNGISDKAEIENALNICKSTWIAYFESLLYGYILLITHMKTNFVRYLISYFKQKKG